MLSWQDLATSTISSSQSHDFRRFNTAITADVSEMFLRIQMPEEDRKYHRFLHSKTRKATPRNMSLSHTASEMQDPRQ
jgi:hypothetical protein